jgi:hypothetical protein
MIEVTILKFGKTQKKNHNFWHGESVAEENVN